MSEEKENVFYHWGEGHSNILVATLASLMCENGLYVCSVYNAYDSRSNEEPYAWDFVVLPNGSKYICAFMDRVEELGLSEKVEITANIADNARLWILFNGLETIKRMLHTFKPVLRAHTTRSIYTVVNQSEGCIMKP